MGRILTSTALLALVLAGTGCAGPAQRAATPSTGSRVDFNGTWSTEWCDRSRPDLDCGGFSVTLVQDGDRICGDFAGALVNLRQVDAGDLAGRIEDGVAILDVRSGRNDSIVRVRATRVGENLHWKAGDTIRGGRSDIDVIALDDVLKPGNGGRQETPEACAAFP